MSTASARDSLSAPYGIALLLVAFASFVYALLSASLFLWIVAVAVVVFLYLFYRLVLAVERIAADS